MSFIYSILETCFFRHWEKEQRFHLFIREKAIIFFISGVGQGFWHFSEKIDRSSFFFFGPKSGEQKTNFLKGRSLQFFRKKSMT